MSLFTKSRIPLQAIQTQLIKTKFTPAFYSSMDQSHAQGDSIVPDKAQQKLPKGVEDGVPDAIHDTGSSKSHATGDSKVPEAVQKAVPEGLEKALPNAIHDTSKGGIHSVGHVYTDNLCMSAIGIIVANILQMKN